MGEQGWNVAAYTCACHPGVMWGIGGDIGPTLSSSPEAADASTFWYGVGAWTAGPAADARTFVGLDDLRAAHPDLTPVAVDNVAALLADHARVVRELDEQRQRAEAAEAQHRERIRQALAEALPGRDCGHDLEAFDDQSATIARIRAVRDMLRQPGWPVANGVIVELLGGALGDVAGPPGMDPAEFAAMERLAGDVAALTAERDRLAATIADLAKTGDEALDELGRLGTDEGLRADNERLTAELDETRKRVAHYERCIDWDATCKACAAGMDVSYELAMRAEEAEAERDRLEAERDEARAKRDQVVENAVAWMDEARHQAVERDRLADTLRQVRELVDSYPLGSNFAQSGLQQLFRRTLGDADGEQKTAHPAASADIRTGPDTLSWADAAARVSADAQAIEASREDLAERDGQRYADLADETGDDRG